MAADSQLASLLLKLFPNPGELERFVRTQYGRQISQSVDTEKGLPMAVYKLTAELEASGRINDDLFDRLLELRPDEANLIERVRKRYARDKVEPPIPRGLDDDSVAARNKNDPAAEGAGASQGTETSPGPDVKRMLWRQKLSQALEALQESEPTKPVAWIDAAAVLTSFNPTQLNPVTLSDNHADNIEKKSQQSASVNLARYCDTLWDGRWRLKLDERRSAIKRIWDQGGLLNALNANPSDSAIHKELLQTLAVNRWIDVASLTSFEELVAMNDIASWFMETQHDCWDANLLTALLERYRRIEPLRKLSGAHFLGRDAELAMLRAHVDPATSKHRILNLVGIGGIGKSALLGKLLLSMNDATEHGPWVYIDFDNLNNDPSKGRRLLEEINKQLSLLYETHDHDAGFTMLESVAARDEHLSFNLSVKASDSVDTILEGLDRALRGVNAEPRLLIVFDTFEQAQLRGETVLALLKGFLDKVLRMLPYAQVIVSGRAKVHWPDIEPMELKDLDAKTADEVLKTYKIESEEVRKRIIELVGCNPLSLRLVADLCPSGLLATQNLAQFLNELTEANVQGQLYTRILGHISQMQVRRLAHPGLIVRRITPNIIAEVLADACELDRNKAEELYELLPKYVTLFEPDQPTAAEPRALRHRQDLRETMLNLMMNDDKWKSQLKSIHDASITYYQSFDDPVNRAEELYHRLMRGDGFELLDPLWSEELKDSLARSWLEPMPTQSREWLGLRLGMSHPDLQGLRVEDWEVVAYREATAQLRAGKAAEALRTLRQRSARVPASPLYRLEVEALRATGNFDEARSLVKKSIQAAGEAGKIQEEIELQLLAASLEMNGSSPDLALQYARQAAELAQESQDALGYVKASVMLLRCQRQPGADADADASLQQLERAFTALDKTSIVENEELARQVVAVAGDRSKTILKWAARAFETRYNQTLLTLDAFKLEALFQQIENSEVGREKLGLLASEVGLPQTGFELIDLASRLISFGKTGRAVAELLDANGDDPKVVQQAYAVFDTSPRERA